MSYFSVTELKWGNRLLTSVFVLLNEIVLKRSSGLIIKCNSMFDEFRSSLSGVFLEKSVLKVCSKFTGEHPCRSAISKKLHCNFIEITLWHGCSRPVSLLHFFRTRFLKNTSGWLLLWIKRSKVTFKKNRFQESYIVTWRLSPWL